MELDGKLDRDALDEITDKVLAYRPRPQPPKKRQPRARRLAHRPSPLPPEPLDDGMPPNVDK